MKHFIKILVVAGMCMGTVSASVAVLKRSSCLSENSVSSSYRFLQKSLRLSHNKKMSDTLCGILALLFNEKIKEVTHLLRSSKALDALNDEEVAYLVRYACTKTNMPSVVTQLCTFPRVTSQISHVYSALKNAISLHDHARMIRCCKMLVECFCKDNEDVAHAKRLFDNKLWYACLTASEEEEAKLKAFQESIDWEASFERFSQ